MAGSVGEGVGELQQVSPTAVHSDGLLCIIVAETVAILRASKATGPGQPASEHACKHQHGETSREQLKHHPLPLFFRLAVINYTATQLKLIVFTTLYLLSDY